jgi:hypothetical protein
MNIQGLDVCPMPLVLKLGLGEVAPRRVEPCVPGDLGEKAAYVSQAIRIVHDTCRLRKVGIRDLLMEVCCAWHRFRVWLMPWQPMVSSR